jgi:hypothetical protein
MYKIIPQHPDAFVHLVFHGGTITLLLLAIGVWSGAFPADGFVVGVGLSLGMGVPVALMLVAALADALAITFGGSSATIVARLVVAAGVYRRTLNVAVTLAVLAFTVPPLLALFVR